MELITVILSGFLAIISSAGLVIDKVTTQAIRSQLKDARHLEVRIDNAPSYQILQGKVERIRIAGRDLKLEENINLQTLEIETDSLSLDRRLLKKTNLTTLRKSLRLPLQAGIHLVVTEKDLNLALRSPQIQAQIQKLFDRLLAKRTNSPTPLYRISNPSLDFLAKNRLRIQLQLHRSRSQDKIDRPLNIKLEFGLKLQQGRSIQIVKPAGTVNGKNISSRLLNGFAVGLSERLDLGEIEKQGIITRLLQLNLNKDKLDIVAFTRIEPFTPASSAQ